MRAITLVARIVLGAVFLVHGLNTFFGFFPIPPPPEGAATAFVGGLAGSGYFFPFLAIMECVCGFLLLVGRFVPLALAMLAPITVHILGFHVFLAPAGLLFAVVLVSLNVFLAVAYRDSFQEMLRSGSGPTKRRAVAPVHLGEGRRGPDVREPAEA
jgi:uncharacterized membrane protein YphA (DoxX/SURF4 family)